LSLFNTVLAIPPLPPTPPPPPPLLRRPWWWWSTSVLDLLLPTCIADSRPATSLLSCEPSSSSSADGGSTNPPGEKCSRRLRRALDPALDLSSSSDSPSSS
jgi:hypothetical protein